MKDLHIKLEDQLHAAVKGKAGAEGQLLSDVVRLLLLAWLGKEKKQ